MPNRLAAATSPYLLQHQDNPVDWYEWSEEVFEEAKHRDVPILLSVGYSACHWCHVMAHESFEDPQTAAEMNRQFVNVKVDREERPDVDSVYMEAVLAMTGRGGWPMTVWLTPDGKPFYAGTYFPKADQHGMPSFRRVMAGIAQAWESRRDELVGQSDRLTAAISRTVPPGDALPGPDVLESAYLAIARSFDAVNGGFGGAPKFPQQSVLEYVLRVREEPWSERADEILTTTLTEMAEGGIHDQIGGGFARYSVDAHWLVPHFEKMLYDNAQLARVYLWAGVELGVDRFTDVASSTLDYLITDLRHPDGGFFSAEDADSEGVEGKFYVWSMAELQEVLGDDAARAAHFFGATPEGNFEGANILHCPTPEVWDPQMESIRVRLLEARRRRVRPGLDDKVISSWNGLAIRALAEAGAVHDAKYLEAARAGARFVLDNLIVEGRLARSWREGRVSGQGFLDDYASMATGLFTLYSATGERQWYGAAIALVDDLERFHNTDGGYYSTPDDAEPLVKRPIDHTDNPLPSGNAMAAEALLLAGLYTGESRYRSAAEEALRSVALYVERAPSMVAHHLSVLHAIHRGTRELAVVGKDVERLTAVYWERFRPHIALASTNVEEPGVPLLAGRFEDGSTRAFVCQGFVCSLPTSDPEVLAEQLGN